MEYNFTSFEMLNCCVKAPHLGLKSGKTLQIKEGKSSFPIYTLTHSLVGQWPSCVLSMLPQFSSSLVTILA
jgi:hypothetical protein